MSLTQGRVAVVGGADARGSAPSPSHCNARPGGPAITLMLAIFSIGSFAAYCAIEGRR